MMRIIALLVFGASMLITPLFSDAIAGECTVHDKFETIKDRNRRGETNIIVRVFDEDTGKAVPFPVIELGRPYHTSMGGRRCWICSDDPPAYSWKSASGYRFQKKPKDGVLVYRVPHDKYGHIRSTLISGSDPPKICIRVYKPNCDYFHEGSATIYKGYDNYFKILLNCSRKTITGRAGEGDAEKGRDHRHIHRGQHEPPGDQTWDILEDSRNKDMRMRQVQLAGAPDLELVGIYENRGNPLMEIKVWGYDFSMVYNTRDMSIWGMIFPGAVAGGGALEFYRDNAVAIRRKGLTKVQYGSSDQWDLDKIRIQHSKDTNVGLYPTQIDFYPVSGSMVDKNGKPTPMFQEPYWNIVALRGYPGSGGMGPCPRTQLMCIKRFKWKGNRTWSEQKCIDLWYNTIKDRGTNIRYGVNYDSFNAWKEMPGAKEPTRYDITRRDGTPADHKAPKEGILIYDEQIAVSVVQS